jgi:ABC-type multidrug transport system ATPase subunit
MIRYRDVTKKYGSITAVSNFSLEIGQAIDRNRTRIKQKFGVVPQYSNPEDVFILLINKRLEV